MISIPFINLYLFKLLVNDAKHMKDQRFLIAKYV